MLSAILERELSPAERVLLVNAPKLSRASALSVAEVGEGDTPEQGFDAVVWECQGDPLLGLRALRRRVRPMGRLLISLRRQKTTWEKLRSVVAGGSVPLTSFDALCGAPLLAGLEEPRVLAESPELAVVAARVPALADPLDALFF